DARCARAGGFGCEVQHLADDARLPEQMAIERRPEPIEALIELGDHAEAEKPVRGDVLIAAHAPCEGTAIAVRQADERERIARLLHQKLPAQRGFETLP